MSLGVIGRKVGMTRVFDEAGVSTPVTVVLVDANRITQVKTEEQDGYSALQVTVGVRRAGRVSAPLKGHFAKAGTEPGRGLWELQFLWICSRRDRKSMSPALPSGADSPV